MALRNGLLFGVTLLTGFASSAIAEDSEVSLSIYNKNIALIEHVRPISAPAGQQRIEFPGVSAQILPATVSFAAPNVTLIEQNFDYDLLTPARMSTRHPRAWTTMTPTWATSLSPFPTRSQRQWQWRFARRSTRTSQMQKS